VIDPFQIVYNIYIAIIGLCFGSFATALVYRIPRNIPWIYNAASVGDKACRSKCTICGAKLTACDLVPLFSWLFSKGKCRHCKAPVSARYPAIEVATMIAVLVLFNVWGEAPYTIPLLLAVPFLVAALVIDWDYMILPNDTNIALTVLAVLYVALHALYGAGNALDAIAAACLLTALLWAVSLILSKWKGRSALGMGDLKFLPAAGLFLGTAALPSYLALCGALGIATALIKRKLEQKQEFPFGPALIISLYLHVILTGLGFDYKW
jgi:leader peptidase (prepilin peptidase)/N-methyltransferase